MKTKTKKTRIKTPKTNVKCRHVVVFESPGILFAEVSSRPIPKWDTTKAMRISEKIVERFGARPYAFRFETLLDAPPLDDGRGGKLEVVPKVIKSSGRFFIMGTARKYDDIQPQEDGRDMTILRDNMRCNNWPLVVQTMNRTQPFEKNDAIVDSKGEVLVKGIDKEFVDYRKTKAEEWKREREEKYGPAAKKS